MTDTDQQDRETLAAEYAMRLLESEELLRARGLEANDPAFAAIVADWEERLGAMLDGVPEHETPNTVWAGVTNTIAQPVAANDANIVALQGKVRRWQWATGLTAAAAALVLALLVAPAMQNTVTISPAERTPEAPLMASIPIGDTPLRLGLTYLPERSEMLVSASGLTADGVHDHELWLVPPEGEALSLGVVVPGEQRRVTLEPILARQIGDGSALVLTREPVGGAKPGTAAGPVVAEGQFQKI